MIIIIITTISILLFIIVIIIIVVMMIIICLLLITAIIIIITMLIIKRWADEANGSKHTGTYEDVLQNQAGAMQTHERQVARQRQQLEYSFAELSRNPHGMSEGEILRSKALEQRERREQRERLRSGNPPRTAAPQAVPTVPGPGSGAVPAGPTASFVPFGDRGLLPEAGDDAFASPEASLFQLDPSAVMSLTSNGSCGRRMHARSLPPEDSSELEPWALAA
eukprot:s3801_g6.t1